MPGIASGDDIDTMLCVYNDTAFPLLVVSGDVIAVARVLPEGLKEYADFVQFGQGDSSPVTGSVS